MKIAVAGGTGTVGRLVMERVRAAGHEPVVLSRAAGVDLRDRAATDRALVGVDALIDAYTAIVWNTLYAPTKG